jgi:hypothetical protein
VVVSSQQLSFLSSRQELQLQEASGHQPLMQQSHVNMIEPSTKEEVLREFSTFYINHRHERLFRHDVFFNLLKQTHNASPVNNHEVLAVLRVATMAQFRRLLQDCRNASALSEKHDFLLCRAAVKDLHELIDYAKHCNDN